MKRLIFLLIVLGNTITFAQNTQYYFTDDAGKFFTEETFARLGIDVYIQDQTTQTVDMFFTKQVDTLDSLKYNTSINDTLIVVKSPSNFAVDESFLIISSKNRFFTGNILSISNDTLVIDSPLDFAYLANDEILPMSKELNVDGSSERQYFNIRGSGGTIDLDIDIDITRIIFEITTTGDPEYPDFGDITNGLTKGVVLRKTGSTGTYNIFNLKQNSDIVLLSYETEFLSATLPVGTNGIVCRYTFSGQDKHGVAIRLSTDEALELIIQDDLSTLLSFRMIAQGHIVD